MFCLYFNLSTSTVFSSWPFFRTAVLGEMKRSSTQNIKAISLPTDSQSCWHLPHLLLLISTICSVLLPCWQIIQTQWGGSLATFYITYAQPPTIIKYKSRNKHPGGNPFFLRQVTARESYRRSEKKKKTNTYWGQINITMAFLIIDTSWNLSTEKRKNMHPFLQDEQNELL